MPASVVINARMLSTRLPKKLFLPLGGKPILGHIVDRVRRAREIDEIIIASPDDGGQKEIRDFCRAEGIKWLQGSKNDLPERLWTASDNAKNNRIVVLTGDLPFLAYEGVDSLVDGFNTHHDYGNTIDGARPYLDGANCEIISAKGIQRQARQATFGRAHACIWIRQAEWEKKLTVDAPISCAKVAHLPVMVDDWGTYYGAQYIYSRLQGETSYGALLWVMEKYMDDIERIERS